MKRIRFVFKEDGTMETEGIGFKGPTCLAKTEELLKALETKLENRKLKQEYNMAQESVESGTQVGG